MSTRRFQTRQFLLPKSGHQLSECEDAIGINVQCRRFAVADGATEAFDAQSWAQRLAHNWVQAETQEALTPEDLRAWVGEQAQSLHDSWDGLRLPWYAEEKARMGSFAAFVGVHLNLDGAPCWQAIALGDSCLIHCREEAVLSTLPVLNYQSFNSTPLLVPSHADIQEAALKQAVVGRGIIETGDVLLLLSDAAAAWYLMLAEKDDDTRALFDKLLKSVRETELAQLFESERLTGRIKDDDIAVISIELTGQ